MDKKYYLSIQNNSFQDFLDCYKICGNHIRATKNKKKIKYAVIYTILKYQNIKMLYYLLTRAYHPKKASIIEMHPENFRNVVYNIYFRECFPSSVFLLKTKTGFHYAKRYIGMNMDRECLASTSKKCLEILYDVFTPIYRFYQKNDN